MAARIPNHRTHMATRYKPLLSIRQTSQLLNYIFLTIWATGVRFPAALSPGVRAEFQNTWSYTSSPPWCSFKHTLPLQQPGSVLFRCSLRWWRKAQGLPRGVCGDSCCHLPSERQSGGLNPIFFPLSCSCAGSRAQGPERQMVRFIVVLLGLSSGEWLQVRDLLKTDQVSETS
jgi:hypothetical protein